MSDIFQCRSLADIIEVVAAQVDQPLDEEGQLSYTNPGEFALACNEAYREVFRMGDALDCELNRNEATVSIAAQGGTVPASVILLPVNLRAITDAWWVGKDGQPSRPVVFSQRRDPVRRDRGTEALFIPKTLTNAQTTQGRPSLKFSRDVAVNQEFLVAYTYTPRPLIHGRVREAAGATSIPLATHESRDTGRLAGVQGNVFRGAGAGQDFTITAWNGTTQIATVGAMGTLLDATSWYTSRPDLHPDCEQALILGVMIWLGRKHHDERIKNWLVERQEMLADVASRLKGLDRESPLVVQDELPWSHADPARTWWSRA